MKEADRQVRIIGRECSGP